MPSLAVTPTAEMEEVQRHSICNVWLPTLSYTAKEHLCGRGERQAMTVMSALYYSITWRVTSGADYQDINAGGLL